MDSNSDTLSEMKKNLLNWYPFKENAGILEIGAGQGELTELFLEKCSKVTVLEFSEEKREFISNKFQSKENLEIITGDIDKLNLQDKYDYITLVGTLEYASFFLKTENPYLDLIKYAKLNLKEDGKLIIATDNSFGIKYFAGAKSEHGDNIFDTILDNTNNGKLFTKNELENLLRDSEIGNYKFYYPLSTYKAPNVIFSDEYLPKEDNSKLMYNILYENDSIIVFNELDVIKNIVKNNLFDKFANSFLIEAGMQEIDNDIKFISYNQIRNKQYRLVLKMHNTFVEKKAVDKNSISHIENMKNNIEELNKMGFDILEKYEDDTVKSDVFNEKTLDQYLYQLLTENKIEEFFEKINNWYEYIKGKQISNDNIEENNGLIILKKCYIDLVFENTVLKNNNYAFYDQEWVLEHTPLEFILYRAINNLYTYHRNIDKIISKRDTFKRLNIFNFTENFEKTEKDFQEKIIDGNILNEFTKPYTFYRDIKNLDIFLQLKEENRKLYSKIEQFESDMKSIKEEKTDLENKYEEINNLVMELDKELADYKNSRLHNLVEKIRKKYRELKNG